MPKAYTSSFFLYLNSFPLNEYTTFYLLIHQLMGRNKLLQHSYLQIQLKAPPSTLISSFSSFQRITGLEVSKPSPPCFYTVNTHECTHDKSFIILTFMYLYTAFSTCFLLIIIFLRFIQFVLSR